MTIGDTLLERGNRAYDIGDYDMAITHYSHALAQQPNNALLYESRAFAFLETQEYHSFGARPRRRSNRHTALTER